MPENSNEKEQPSIRKRERTQIMTLKEVAKYLGLHPISIYRLIKTTDIPAMKIGGQWRFKKDILDNWLTNQSGKLDLL